MEQLITRLCWRGNQHVETLYGEPRPPWQNAYVKGFNGKLKQEVITGKPLTSLLKTQVLTRNWREGLQAMSLRVATRSRELGEQRDAFDNVTYLSHIDDGGVALEPVKFGLSTTQLQPEGGIRDAG